MEVLYCFADSKTELGVTEIAQKLRMNKSTIFNTLATLAFAGILCKNPVSNKYYPALNTLKLSNSALIHSGIRELFTPYLLTLMQRTRKVCSHVVLEGTQLLYTLTLAPEGYPQAEGFPGETAPLHCTSAGKVFLAYMNEEDLQSALLSPLESYTSLTVTKEEDIRNMLPEIRTRGYAIDNMEHTYGIRSVAIPLFRTDRQVTSAICVTSPTTHFSLETIEETAQIMEETLRPLQHRL